MPHERIRAVAGGDENLDKIKSNIDNVKPNKLEVTNAFDDAGKLKKNVRYKSGEFEYWGETDELGRLESMTTDNLQITDREKRLIHQNKTAGKEFGDHAGHLIGDRFGGSKELDNIVSQLSSVNLSDFKIIENKWAKALSEVPPSKVEVNIKVIYEADGIRPSEFEVKYKIDGKLSTVKISNVK